MQEAVTSPLRPPKDWARAKEIIRFRKGQKREQISCEMAPACVRNTRTIGAPSALRERLANKVSTCAQER